MIIFATGIRPRDELAKKCEMDLGHRGGIAIDDNCQTSEKNIWVFRKICG